MKRTIKNNNKVKKSRRNFRKNAKPRNTLKRYKRRGGTTHDVPLQYMKLKPWVDESNLNWDALSANPNAIYLLEKNQDKINWDVLSKNINAIHLLEKNQDKINWHALSMNINAIPILQKNPDKIDWYALFIVKLLTEDDNIDGLFDAFKANIDKILDIIIPNKVRLETLLNNINNPRMLWFLYETKPEIFKDIDFSDNPAAIRIFKENPKYINWKTLSLNPHPEAIQLLKKHPRLINWDYLSQNQNPDAIQMIQEFIENNPANRYYMDWSSISENQHAIKMLKENPEFIDWYRLSQNKHPDAMQMIEKFLETVRVDPENYSEDEKVSWDAIAENPNAFNLISKYLDRIDRESDSSISSLCSNKNKDILNLLKTRMDNISYYYLFKNPSAIELIEATKLYEKIHHFHPVAFNNCMEALSENPNIFEFNYSQIHKRQNTFRESLMRKALHPSRLAQVGLDFSAHDFRTES